ncbi:MAG: dTDP-4-dehydrorhamnose reductase [Methanotrichaceae archaeon]|nr:dTDP-4-dehydrorhamnose reductase [Methanotrichaceae archaeon]
MTELLVIGGGLLGGAVASASRERFRTAVTYNSHPLQVEGCATYQMDITGSVDLIRSLKPQYIVLTAAMTNVDACESDRIAAWKANALGPKNVALAARDIGAKLIHVSTDYVFDGERGMYREDDPTSPINYYGESKLAGESAVQDILEDYVIARTSVLYGWNPSRLNFVTWAVQEMGRGNKINIVNDQYNSPTLSSNLADMILSLKDETGIFHTAGSERISRYDFSLKIARAFGLDESLIIPISSDALNWKARRPRDSSLDISLVSSFSKPLNVEEGLKSMVKVAKQGMVT